jgi:PKD repeat protein
MERLLVDPSGNSIITEGCCSGNIIKVDSTGDVEWSLINGVDEYWRLAYNCDYTRLYLAVAYASSPGLQFESLCLVDTATGGISNSTVIFSGQQTEPRALAVGMDGNMYTISCTGYLNSNEVAAMDPSYSIIFSESSGYNLLYNGPLYTNGINSTSGQNAVSAGNNFLCTSNGSTLFKRDKNNGGFIASTSISGGSVENNSGILVDSCDNIFVGSSNAVIKYDSFLNVISTTPTTGAVYCLAPSISGNLLVCGNGFIASMDLDVCRNIFCMDANPNPTAGIVASATEVCQKFCVNYFDSTSNNAVSWQWLFPGGSPSTSTLQNPTNICYDVPGLYDVTLITTGPNGSDTLTKDDYITVYSTPPFPTVTQNGYTLTSSPANSYQWQLNSIEIPGATDQSYTVCKQGTIQWLLLMNMDAKILRPLMF